jgi:hypothetical protein
MIGTDRNYLERRAEDELDCAQQASHPAAVRAHYELLGYYLNQLYPGDSRHSAERSSRSTEA